MRSTLAAWTRVRFTDAFFVFGLLVDRFSSTVVSTTTRVVQPLWFARLKPFPQNLLDARAHVSLEAPYIDRWHGGAKRLRG
jgi:hypothetical protein